MFLDKSLSAALLISLIFHAAILLPLSYFKSSSVRKPPAFIKVTYVAPERVPPKKTLAKEKSVTKITRQAGKKDLAAEVKVDSSIEPKDRAAKEKLEIAIPPELPKEKEAAYLNYYQSIREKIRKFVVKNYPRYIACGEVCLYFVLSADGRLEQIKIVEEESGRNRLLKEIARRSVQEAAPFPPFPKDLGQSQLSFNVIISFELEQ